jgi:hypothetical protein
LFCDNLELVHQLAGIENLTNLVPQGLELNNWLEAETINLSNNMPQIVIETFSCELPTNYASQIVNSKLINIEYLTAESWTEEIHCLATIPSVAGQKQTLLLLPRL